MIITKKWLEEKQACNDGVSWFLAQKETNAANVAAYAAMQTKILKYGIKLLTQSKGELK